MKMTGMYHIALLEEADEQAFVKNMTEVVFKNPGALQATRITQSIAHQLLKKRSDLRQYVWQVTVHLITDREYDFAENLKRVQQHVQGSGLVIALDVYTNVGA